MTTIAFVAQPWARILPPSESVALATREVARRVAREFPVVVYARGAGETVEVERQDGVEYRLVPAELDWRAMKAATPVRLLTTTRRPFFAGRFFHPVYFRAVARDLAKLRPAVVQVDNFSQLLPVLRRAAPESRRVLQMHCDWLADLSRPMIARRLRSADLVLGCSDHVTNRIRVRFPELAERVQTRVHGVDVDRFRPVGDRPTGRLFFAGRVAPDKGLHVLADAFRELRPRFPDLELELVGPEAPVAREMQVALSSDPLVRALDAFYGRSYVEALRERLGEDAAAVRFSGRLEVDEMPARYRTATIGVQPSFEEAFGLPVVEAMATSLPVVATRVGGLPEIVVDGVTGLLVPAGDALALAAAIERLLADPELAGRMGAAGRRRAVERYSWDVVAEQALGHYRRLIEATLSGSRWR
jgi:glycosyltransferase involved in cell wall biosynthesis